MTTSNLYQIEELAGGQFSAAEVIEISSIPDVSTFSIKPGVTQTVDEQVKYSFSNLLSEIYQHYAAARASSDDEISLEILWLTQHASNQIYKADIRLFLIVRAINSDKQILGEVMGTLCSVCVSTLDMNKFEHRSISPAELIRDLKSTNQNAVRALVKDEKLDNFHNAFLDRCFSYQKLPESNSDLSAIINSLLNHPECAISFQLIPTTFTPGEQHTLDSAAQLFNTMHRGFFDASVGNISFALAEQDAATFKYYAQNEHAPLFRYNILVFGDPQAVASICTRLYGHLHGPQGNLNTKLLELPPSDVRLTSNFFPLPWAINELILDRDRNPDIWVSNNTFANYYRLPYIITASEASEFFRLPVANKDISAGFSVNRSDKSSRSYYHRIINAGDIVAGVLSNSAQQDTIGLYGEDLTKHMLIVGSPGCGKTTFSIGILGQLWKIHHIPFLVIEPAKTEYRALVQHIPELQIFTPGKRSISPFLFNPFIPPKNVILESYKSTLKTAFSAAVTMSSPLDKIFEETVNDCYSDFGWLDSYKAGGKGRVFNISDFIKCFETTFERIGYTGDAKNIGRAGIVRLNNVASLFDTYNSVPVEDLLARPTLIELAAIDNDEQKALLIALLLLNIFSFVNANYHSDGMLKNAILLEEAHVLLDSVGKTSEGEANPSEIAKSLLRRMLAEIRAYGVGVIIADQSPRKVSSDVVGLTNIKVSFRLVEASDKEIIVNCTNMTEANMQRLARLKPGEAFLYYDKLDDPEEIKTHDYRKDNAIPLFLTDEAVKKLPSYWHSKGEWLRPYPECTLMSTCTKTCNSGVRELAREIARRIYLANFTADTSDYSVLKKTYARIEASTMAAARSNGESFSKELGACVKLHFLRRVKYLSKVQLSDTIISETLRKI